MSINDTWPCTRCGKPTARRASNGNRLGVCFGCLEWNKAPEGPLPPNYKPARLVIRRWITGGRSPYDRVWQERICEENGISAEVLAELIAEAMPVGSLSPVRPGGCVRPRSDK